MASDCALLCCDVVRQHSSGCPPSARIRSLNRAPVRSQVISILTDVNGFWKYDNREMLVHDNNNEHEQS